MESNISGAAINKCQLKTSKGYRVVGKASLNKFTEVLNESDVQIETFYYAVAIALAQMYSTASKQSKLISLIML
jgi:hypothetical protein